MDIVAGFGTHIRRLVGILFVCTQSGWCPPRTEVFINCLFCHQNIIVRHGTEPAVFISFRALMPAAKCIVFSPSKKSVINFTVFHNVVYFHG